MTHTHICVWCGKQFTQDTTGRRGRPFRKCEACRKLLWYEKYKIEHDAKEDAK